MTLLGGALTPALIEGYDCVVCVDLPLESQSTLELNSACRAAGVKFVAADVRGVFSWCFVDFGDNFVTRDKDGEPVREVMLHEVNIRSQIYEAKRPYPPALTP